MKFTEIIEGKYRANDIEEFKPKDSDLDDLKSQYLPDWEMLDHRELRAKYVAKDHRHAEGGENSDYGGSTGLSLY